MEPIKQFQKYPSIENVTNTKLIQKTKNDQISHSQTKWASLEKIHGANFSIEYVNNTATYCRRKDFVSKPIPVPCQQVAPFFIEKFFNCERLVQTFHNKLADISNSLAGIFPNMNRFYLFGQYFGGYWPKTFNPEIAHVQKGVYYSPNHHFYVFDCLIQNQRWLSVKELVEIIGVILPVVPVYKIGSFQEMLNIDSVLNSTIPALLGLNMDQKNICQGMVIRPYESPKHIIYKKKNQQFLQITNAPIPKQQKQKQKTYDEVLIVMKELRKYLNVNRVSSAFSKMPDASILDLGIQITNDILDEATKDNLKFPESESSLKRLKQILKNEACNHAAKYLKEIKGDLQTKEDCKKGDKIQQMKDLNVVNQMQSLQIKEIWTPNQMSD